MTIDDTREPTWAAELTDTALADAAKEVIESLDGAHFPIDGKVRELAAAVGERLTLTPARATWCAVLAIKEEVMVRWLRKQGDAD